MYSNPFNNLTSIISDKIKDRKFKIYSTDYNKDWIVQDSKVALIIARNPTDTSIKFESVVHFYFDSAVFTFTIPLNCHITNSKQYI